MKSGSWARKTILAAAVVAAVVIPGCSGFWDPPSSDDDSSSSDNPASGYFYVLNQKASEIAGFSFTASTTTPVAVGSSPYALVAIPYALAIMPDGGALFVSTAAGIYVYTVNSDGSLTLGNSSQPISADAAYSMQVDTTGQWLLEVVSGSGALSAIPIDSSGDYDSSRDPVSVALPSVNVTGIAVSPSGGSASYAFVAMGTGGTAVVPFTAGNTDPFGSVKTIKVKNSLGGDNAVAVSPDNSLLYVGETAALSSTQSGGLRVFTIGSGSALQEISGSPYASGGTGPSAILATSDAVYVANKVVSGKSVGNITGYSVASSSGAYTLTGINTVSAGVQTAGLAADSTGSYVLAVNYGGSPDLSTFTFSSTTTGKLVAGPTASTGTDTVGAWAIVAAPGS